MGRSVPKALASGKGQPAGASSLYNTRMAAPPLPPSMHVSDFFERKRRLAYYFAWLAMTLLLVQLAVGFVPNFFGQPRPAISDGGLSLFYRCLSQEETDTSRFLVLDSAMK